MWLTVIDTGLWGGPVQKHCTGWVFSSHRMLCWIRQCTREATYSYTKLPDRPSLPSCGCDKTLAGEKKWGRNGVLVFWVFFFLPYLIQSQSIIDGNRADTQAEVRQDWGGEQLRRFLPAGLSSNISHTPQTHLYWDNIIHSSLGHPTSVNNFKKKMPQRHTHHQWPWMEAIAQLSFSAPL